MVTFLHAADIHLDSPLLKLERYEGAPVDALRGATRRALENLVELALSIPVDFVLIVGDLYDRDWKDYNTGLYFAAQMSRLREADIPVFLIFGNHDAASRITRTLRLPANVRQMPSDRPATIRLDTHGVAIHGQGYTAPKVTRDLSAAYPPRLDGYFNIGMLHTSANGREGYEPYAPCRIEDLVGKGYDYWALGHVHEREIIHETPHIVFPGNIQGRHIREVGPKGCCLIEVDDGNNVNLEFRALDVIRWARLGVDISSASDGDAALDLFCDALETALAEADGLPLAARVELTGPCRAHDILSGDADHWIQQIRATATDLSGGQVWIEKVKFNTRPVQRDKGDHPPDGPVGELLRMLETAPSDPEILRELGTLLDPLWKKLPHEMKSNGYMIGPDDDRWLAEKLESVGSLLLHRLMSRGGDQ